MDNPIEAIIVIDKGARNVVAAAKSDAEKIISAAEEEKKQLGEQSEAKLAAQTEERCNKLRSDADAEIAATNSTADERCRLLSEKMQSGRDGWKAGIVSRIIGR